MDSRSCRWAAISAVAFLAGCRNVTITAPAHNATNIVTPLQLQVTVDPSLGPLTVTLDGNNLSDINGTHSQLAPAGTLFALTPSSHSLVVSGDYTFWGSTLTSSDTSNFTVTASPLSYSCPTGYVHAFFVQCCNGNKCDVAAFTNFGPTFLNLPSCNLLQNVDCINQNGLGICGANAPYCGTGSGAETAAVSFVPSKTGTFSQIQIPVRGAATGPTAFQIWITNDNSGVPGGVVEGPLLLNNIPNFTINYIVAPSHIFSVARPTLTAGQTYWLVVAPATNTTTGTWNFSSGDTPTANGSNFLGNTTGGASGIPGLMGPWARIVPSNLPLRPAFEIDIR